MDEELIDLLVKRDPAGLEELKRRFGPLIMYVVEAILPDRRDAEECASDVYMSLWDSAGRLDRTRPLRPYVAAAARNAAVSRARRAGAGERELTEDMSAGPTPEEQLLRRERVKALNEALSRLGDSDRRLLYRKYYYRQSTAQIAAELGKTERSVEGRLYRIRQKLRDMMGGDWDD